MCKFNEEGSRRENGYEGTHMGQSLIVEFGPYVEEPGITDIEIMQKIVDMRVKRQRRVPPTDFAEVMHYNRLAYENTYGFMPILNPEAYEEHELMTEEEFYQEQFERQPVEEHAWLVHQRGEVVVEVDVAEDEAPMNQEDGEIEVHDIDIPQNIMDQEDEERRENEADITPNRFAVKRELE